ncbi:OsmC family protein [Indiicoccus explosivorum]|uniref:OsmC family protein n=1 Tax=Indiicoccus explosivorum TaxID=1917864 RepID=UPI000B4315F6|nr:OsmC family protein [Indiicoccus explosivorum]
MKDLHFEAQFNWSGTGKDGEGRMTAGQQLLTYSSPADMGGKGTGLSPEDLLISAVSTCYSGTLFRTLTQKKLPAERVSIQSEGIVADFPVKSKFSTLIVNPTVIGGDPSRQKDYEEAAEEARENCFIGKTIAGNVDYRVGTVRVHEAVVPQGKVDELVDRFYVKLIRDPYYSSMFEERGVNVDVLKERQRMFISRLINGSPSGTGQSEKEQVQRRHSFSTTPERAEVWLGLMGETVNEMDFPQELKENLMEKMHRLMKPLVK